MAIWHHFCGLSAAGTHLFSLLFIYFTFAFLAQNHVFTFYFMLLLGFCYQLIDGGGLMHGIFEAFLENGRHFPECPAFWEMPGIFEAFPGNACIFEV